MQTGARIEAFLVRHGTWFMPGVLALFALAMVLILVLDREPAVADGRVVVLPHDGSGAARRGTPVPAADATVAAVPVLPSLSPTARDGRMQVCAVGWAGVDAAGHVDLDAIVAAPAVDQARRELLRALAINGDPFVRAASSLLQGDAGASGALAEAAAATRDPRVYAMAYRACLGRERGASCRLVDGPQWSRLDDGNALPWLYALDDAAKRGDGVARDDALFRIASARRLDERPFAVAAAVADAAGRDDAALLAAWTLGVDAAAAAAAQTAPFGALTAACSSTTASDANRAQLCHGAAELLLERSDSVDAFLAGTSIARGLGRDVARGDDVARKAAAARGDVAGDGYDCPRLRRDLARWQEGAAVGEVALLRRRP